MSTPLPKIFIEVRYDGENANLFEVHDEGKSFGFQKFLAKGSTPEMRQKAQELLERNIHIPGLSVREIDLAKARESRESSRSPEIAG